MQRFQERLKARRNALNLSQPALADRSGVSERAIAGYETKGNPPSLRIVDKLASALSVTSTWLLGGDESQFLKEPMALSDAPVAGPISPYHFLETKTLDRNLQDLAARLSRVTAKERKFILDNMRELLAELARREVSSKPLSEAQQIAKQASARDDGEHHHPA